MRQHGASAARLKAEAVAASADRHPSPFDQTGVNDRNNNHRAVTTVGALRGEPSANWRGETKARSRIHAPMTLSTSNGSGWIRPHDHRA
jgi:hypothetical protein